MTPAGERHPDFEPANTLSLRHGARSPRAIAARAREVHAQLLTYAPYLDEPRFIPACQRYLDAAAVEAMLQQHVEQVRETKGMAAVPVRVLEQLTAARRLAAKLGSDLGLDPIGHARIRSLSVGAEAQAASVADLISQGRQVMAERDAATLPVSGPVVAADALDGPDDPEVP